MIRKILVLIAIFWLIYQAFMLWWDGIKYLKKEYVEIKKAFKDSKNGKKVKLDKYTKKTLWLIFIIMVLLLIAIYRMIYYPISDAETIWCSILLAAILITMSLNNK